MSKQNIINQRLENHCEQNSAIREAAAAILRAAAAMEHTTERTEPQTADNIE